VIDCVFCRIIAGYSPATVVCRTNVAIAIVPLNPVTPGHLLVIPTIHVADFTEKPSVSAAAMHFAANVAWDMGPCNLITSKGREATQSVFHLHIHIVPRAEDDGLALPWHSGRSLAEAVS
jgi:histidine triad (HIT) family protein